MAKKKRRPPLPERIPQALSEALQLGVDNGSIPSPTVYALAKNSSLLQQTVANWMNCYRSPSPAALQRFADALGIDVDIVFSLRK